MRFRYSNAGYIVLGLVIEAVTGSDFADHVAESVFRKAGMVDSGFFELDAVHERLSIGYVPEETTGHTEDTVWRTNHFSVPARGGPDGGAFSTAPDLRRFFLAMEESRLVGSETRREMWQPRLRVDDDTSYGYGFWMFESSGKVRMIGGVGEDPGCSARAFRRIAPDCHLIVLSNHSVGARSLVRKLREILDGSFG